MRDRTVVLIVIGIIFGSLIFGGQYTTWQEEQIENKRLDMRSQERIELEKIKAERERIEVDKLKEERLEAERLESLKTPEQKEADLLEAESINQERIDRNNQEREENLKSNTSNVENSIIEQSLESTQMSLTCEVTSEELLKVTNVTTLMYDMCHEALLGDFDNFYQFSKRMSIIQDASVSKGNTVKLVNAEMWSFLNKGESCTEVEITVEYNKALNGMNNMVHCFENLEENFGWFPMNDFGEYVSTEYLIEKDTCNIFCDINDYEPQWAKNMGPYQAASRCTTIMNNWENSDEWDVQWCTELSGFLLS